MRLWSKDVRDENTRAILEFSNGNSSYFFKGVIEKDEVTQAEDFRIYVKHTNKKFLWVDVDPNIPNKYMRLTWGGGPSRKHIFKS